MVGLARKEAHSFDHHCAGAKHLILGPVREDGGVATSILDDLGVLGRVRGETLRVIGHQASDDREAAPRER